MLRLLKTPPGLVLVGAIMGALLLAAAQRFFGASDTPIADWAPTSLTVEGCKAKAKEAIATAGAKLRDEQAGTLTADSWANTVKVTCLPDQRLVHFTTVARQKGAKLLLGAEVKRTYAAIERAIPEGDASRQSGIGLQVAVQYVPLKHMKLECMQVADATLKAFSAREIYRDSNTIGLSMKSGALVALACPSDSSSITSIIPARQGDQVKELKAQVAAQIESQLETLSPTPSRQFTKALSVSEWGIRGKFSADLCLLAARNSLKALGRTPFTDGTRISSEKDGVWASVTCYRDDSAQMLAIATPDMEQGLAKDTVLSLKDEMGSRLPLR